MRKIKLYLLMALCLIFAVLAVAWGVVTLGFLVAGVCGVTVFDAPDWAWQLAIVVALPAATLFVAIKVIRYCRRQLPFSTQIVFGQP
jgi:membrane protein implicated in regulation of membrane protease activity